MTTSVSYPHVEKSLYAIKAGDATDANPLIICSALPIDYGINRWSAAANALDITKCFLCSWDGFNFVKLVSLTADEKEMQGDFLSLLKNAATSTDIQKFLDNRPEKVAIAYSAGSTGAATDVDLWAYIEVSRFKSK